MNICVYCASSDAVAPAYFRAAEALGQMIAQRGDTLVYGGAGIGLMGALARAVKAGGGHVIGVMPRVLAAEPITFALLDEFVITHDLRERKARMEALADAFLVLPGGFGTLEELAEILTLRQLREHTKPVVLLNIQRLLRAADRVVRALLPRGVSPSRGASSMPFMMMWRQALATSTLTNPILPRKWFEPGGERSMNDAQDVRVQYRDDQNSEHTHRAPSPSFQPLWMAALGLRHPRACRPSRFMRRSWSWAAAQPRRSVGK